MSTVYGRDLDLNLLRVFVTVADAGSVTSAASRLYLTQPAVSAALRRLQATIGARLFVRHGRGLELTQRGERLLNDVRPHLIALLGAALEPTTFDPATSDRTLRLGVSDGTEQWLLPQLLRVLGEEAPRMRLVVVPVQFRTVREALTTRGVDAAVTVADELPPTVKRRTLFVGSFVCLYDPRHARVKKHLTERAYFDHDHVIVSYNGDLRGIVEDALGRSRSVRCSMASLANVGTVVSGTPLLATVPKIVAEHIVAIHPHLRTAPLPFELQGSAMELLWPSAVDEDDACRFLRAKVVEVAERMQSGRRGARPGHLRAP